MAVEDYIPDGSGQTTGSVQDIQSITFLWPQSDGVNNGRNRIFRLQPPLMVVEMEYMGLFDSAVNQTYLRRVTHICPKDRRSSEADMPADSAITIDERRLLRTLCSPTTNKNIRNPEASNPDTRISDIIKFYSFIFFHFFSVFIF